MKTKAFITLLTILIFTCTSCTTSSSEKKETSYEEVKKELEAIHKSSKSPNLPEDCKILEKLISQFPTTTPLSDSVVYYARQTLSMYCSHLLISHEYKNGIRFLESQSSSPFIDKYAKYELTAILAHIYQVEGNNEKAIALADSFIQLPDPVEKERLIQYSEMIGSVYFYCGRRIEKAITILEKAREAYLQGGVFPNIDRLLFRLGNYYRTIGNYEDAIKINQEVIKLFERNDTKYQRIVMAYGELGNIYFTLGLTGEALKYNTIACQYSKKCDNYALGDLYRFRAGIFETIHQKDSTFHYLHKAIAASKSANSFKGVFTNNLDLARAYLNTKDSASKAEAILQHLYADSAQVPRFTKEQLNLLSGQIMLNKGNTTQALELIENAAGRLKEAGILEEAYRATQLLMNTYLQKGMNDTFASAYPAYQTIRDSVSQDERVKALAAANIQFSTQRTEQENKLLTNEIELKNKDLQLYTFGGLALLFISLSIGIWLWMRQRTYRLHLRLEEERRISANVRLQEQEEKLKQLITSRQELNNHNEELLRQLADIQAENEQTCHLDHVMEKLQPRLLTPEEEKQFRNSFSALYPTALHNLRTHCPKVTKTEELLCMLIVLKQTNDEIAYTLGINRPSVIQTRYRLRTKLNLTEGSNLDDEIRAILMQ